jgi:phosphoribosyl 1,2-cyclic phosphate phosphodiesterase
LEAGRVRRSSVASVLQPNHPDPPTLLLDAGPDLWSQWMDWEEAPLRPDAVIASHSHFDHVFGLANFWYCDPPVPLYALPETLADIERLAASSSTGGREYDRSGVFNMEPRALPERGAVTIGGVRVETVPLHHVCPLAGVLVRHRGRFFAHLSDTSPVVEAPVREALRGCDVLVVNAPGPEGTGAHLGFAGAVALARDVGAERLVLTHISHSVRQEALAGIEAAHPWVTVAYDGMVLDV